MSASANWGGTLPVAADTLRINGACIVDNAFNNRAYGPLEVSRGATGSVSWPAGGTATLNVSTVLFGSAGAGTINMTNGGTLQIRTGWTSTNTTLTPGAGTVNWNVTAANSTLPATVTTYNNLTITAGTRTVTLGADKTVTGTLTLTSGTLAVGANTLTLNGPAIAGTATNLSTTALSSLVFGGSSAGVSIPSSVAALNNLTINNSNGVTQSGNLTLSGTLTLTSGTFSVGANTLALNGPAIAGTPTNLSTTSSSNLSFGGSSAGVTVPGSVTALNNLTVGNSSGIALNSSVTVGGTLTLSNGSGPVTTGANTLIASANCPASVSRTGGFVIGNLQLTFPAGGATCIYDVGTGTAYAPITLKTPTLSSGGTLTGTTIGNEHPQIATSALDANKDANRYWSLWVSGDTISASSYDASFTFIAGDLDSGTTATNFVLAKYASGAWTTPTPVTANGTSVAVTGIAGPLGGSTTSFAIGEAAFVCSVPTGLPAGMTCVCDNFGRSSLNPSTIFGGNYTLTQSSGTAGWPQIATSGYLQLTNSSGNMATSATLPGTFPAKGNLITVEFKHYAYAPSGSYGADGIALTLSDAAVNPQPGAYGGSLGYAQKTTAGGGGANINGFAGGWIGIGLDEFGNYSSNTEGRIGGPVNRPNSVAIRGSGDLLVGYPYLTGTATLTPTVSSNLTIRGLGHSYRIMVDARGYTWNGTSGTKSTLVSVDRDTAGGTTYSSLILPFDAYALNPGQTDVPVNWKLSYTGSTGGAWATHELTGLKVCAQTITPPAGYRIQIDNLTPSTCGTPGGSPSSPIATVTALDSNGNAVTTYNKTINLTATLPGGGAASATWRKVGAGANLPGNQYTFVAADNGVAQFYLTDANTENVTVTVSESAGTLVTSSATPIQYSGGATFDITNIDSLSANAGGGVVAGRSHLMQIRRTLGACGSGTNTGYTGARSLDGWYTPAAGDHPTGADAPQICATNAGGTCLPNTGACQTLSIAPPAVAPTSNNMPSLTFALGIAKLCIATTDVGKYSVSLRDDSATPVIGTSGTLTARPFAVGISNVKQGSTPNPADNTASGGILANAGTNFEATVAGYLWNSAAAAGGNGLPDASANFADVTANGTAPHYADTVTLSAGAPFAPTTPLDAPPGTGTAGTLSNGAVAVTNGSTTQLTLSYNEVGSFTLKAAPSTGYLNSGIDLANRVAIFAKDPALSTAQNGVVGRFKPDHFSISSASIGTRADLACAPASTFTYMGEPMTANFTLAAKNYANDVTMNYAGAYAKLALTPASVFSFGAIDSIAPVPLTGRLNTSMATTGSWIAGTATMIAPIALNRGVAPDGPYNNFKLGIKPQDSEGVTLLAGALNLDTDNNAVNDKAQISNATIVRFGRLRLSNAHGSELLRLPVPIEAQYWSSNSGFVTNVDDNCTTIAGNTIIMGPYTKNLSPAPTCETTVPGSTVLGNGRGLIVLSRPGTGNNGSVDLTLNLNNGAIPNTFTCAAPSTTQEAAAYANQLYLQGGAGYNTNPAARGTFGIYKSGPVIYMREMY